jgi:hypothetical protein
VIPSRRSRATLLVVLGIALAAAASSCGDGSDEGTKRDPRGAREVDRSQPYSEAEREWLEKWGDWRLAIDVAVRLVMIVSTDPDATKVLRGGDPEAIADISSALGVIEDCSTNFRAQVGRAPSARLREGEAAALEACPQLERGATEDLRALETRSPELLDAGDGLIEAGADRLWVSNENVLLRTEGRDLPEKDGPSGDSRVDTVLGRVADTLAEDLPHSIEVRCWSSADWAAVVDEMSAYTGDRITVDTLGFAAPDLVRVHLSPLTCERLGEIAYERRLPAAGKEVAALADAVVTLAHEAMHVAWVDDEAEAECLGAQLAFRTAVELGVEKDYARKLARTYWESMYPRLPKEYRSPECRNGGELDIHPESSVWP